MGIACQPKEQGGLGIQKLDIQNKCLLSKWLFKLYNKEGVWEDLLGNKYFKKQDFNPSLSKSWGFTFLDGFNISKGPVHEASKNLNSGMVLKSDSVKISG